MREVTKQLYYGGIESAADLEQYRRHGIEHVIQLTYEEPTDGYPEHIDVHTFSMMDGPQNDTLNVSSMVAATQLELRGRLDYTT